MNYPSVFFVPPAAARTYFLLEYLSPPPLTHSPEFSRLPPKHSGETFELDEFRRTNQTLVAVRETKYSRRDETAALDPGSSYPPPSIQLRWEIRGEGKT